jgi:zinc protease
MAHDRGTSGVTGIRVRAVLCHVRLLCASAVTAFVFTVLLTTVSYAGLDVKREVLNNGLTLLVTERHNLPLVMVTMGIRAGALLEPPDRSGLANLVAELLTEGTETRTGKQISEEIEFVGGSLGASAGDDYITVSLSVLKKDISLGFELLSDIVLNPVFPEQEMKKKVERTKAGLKSAEENPGFVASRVFIREVFGDHPYGRLVQGSEETLDRITRGDLVDFYANNYVPNSSVLSVVGDITPKEEPLSVLKSSEQGKRSPLTVTSRRRTSFSAMPGSAGMTLITTPFP